MKKLTILLIIALVAGSAIGLMILREKRAERASIQEVLNERSKAREVIQKESLFYVVQQGDTLPEIARRFGVTLAAVQSANGLRPPSRVHVGQKLVDPRGIALAKRDYRTELGKIDPSACPKKFQDAWMNYVKTWELQNDTFIQQENQLDRAPVKAESYVRIAGNGLDFGRDTERPNLHNAAERLEKLDNTEAWLNCKRVAMDFGVFAPSDL